MTVACVKLKITLPNTLVRGKSGTPKISNVELFVAIALDWKPAIFVPESSMLGRRYRGI